MRFIASILLLGAFVRHDAAGILAPIFGLTPAWMFYILSGIWEALLCSVILVLALQMRFSIWRQFIVSAMWIGIIEATEIPVCSVAAGFKNDTGGLNLCDYAFGFPFGKVVMVLYFLVLVWNIGRWLVKPTS